MNIEILCRKIRLPDSVTQQVLQMDGAWNYDQFASEFSLLMERKTGLEGFGALSAALGEDPLGLKMLTCQLHCACVQYDSYRKLGISDEIYFATMSCYTRFVQECLSYKGSYKFDRGWWTWRQLSLSVFRIGQLEYELREEGNVAMHIPSGSDLSPDLVDQSLAQVRAFISRYFPGYSQAQFTCKSWLLSPMLKGLLKPESRILHFMSRFQLMEVEEDNQDYISWLFQSLPGVPVDTLPQRTSLQRDVKNYLLEGGKIGTAFGVLQ